MKVFFALLILSSGIWAKSMPLGSYTNGSLINGECLPESGDGYMQLYREMERIWGTLPLVNMIQKSAADLATKYPGRDRLQVEDLSAKEGGDIDGHASHENGLDVDLGYMKANGVEHDPVKTGQMYAPSMVNGNTVSENFDVERNWELMKALHRHGDVQRIFVDQVIKNKLCEYAKSKNEYKSSVEVLRSLRHVENHADHLHVRIRCPKDAKKCVNQAELPKGSGCPK